MRFTALRAAAAAAVLGLAGCATGPKTLATNAATGDPGGRPPGQTAASIVASMQGGLVGGLVGQELSSSDRRRALEAEYQALEYTPSGQTITWRSERSGRYGEVVAAAPYRVGSQDCRQYSHTVYTGGPARSARGTACRNGDGSWTPLT